MTLFFVFFKCLIFTVRIHSSTSLREGEIQIERNGQWSTICSRSWELNIANVLCRQLGFPSALKALDGNRAWMLSIATNDVWYYSVESCSGDEDSLDTCSLKKNRTSCLSARVICQRGTNKEVYVFCPVSNVNQSIDRSINQSINRSFIYTHNA